MVEELSAEIERLKAEQDGSYIMEACSQSELNGQLHDDLTARLNELQVEVASLRHQNKSTLMQWVKFSLHGAVANEAYCLYCTICRKLVNGSSII